jgi:hypothetical protein
VSRGSADLPAAIRVGLAVAALLAAAAGVKELVDVLRTPELVIEDTAAARVLHRERVTVGDTLTLAAAPSPQDGRARTAFRIQPDGRLAEIGPTGSRALRPALTVTVVPAAAQRVTTPAGVDLDLLALVPAGGTVKIHVR